MPWEIEIGSVTSICALLISAAALAVSWRVHRRQVKAELPVVTASVGRRAGHWWPVYVWVRNRSEVSWTIEETTIAKPRGAKVILAGALRRADPDQPWKILDVPPPSPESLSNKARIGVVLRAVGAPAGGMGASESHGEWLSVFDPSASPRLSLSIRLILRSNAAERRSITIVITRTATDDSSTASD